MHPSLRAFAFFGVLVAASLLGCHRGSKDGEVSGLARIRASGVLRWGGDVQGGEPNVYADPKHPGELIGFEVELAAAIARDLGVRAEFVQNDWSNLVPSLERGSFDIALNGLEITASRRGRILFTRPYYIFAERLMARKGDARFTTDLASLKGHRVGTLNNSYAFELLRGRSEVVAYEGTEEPYLDLVQGRTDAVLLDDIIAARYGEPSPDLSVVGDVSDGYYAVGVAKSEPDVRAAVDLALAHISASGQLQQILTRSSLWNARQEPLRSWTDSDQRAVTGAPPDPPRMSLSHVWLFARGALMTLFLSTTAMVLAVVLGLTLALIRTYGGRTARTLATAYVEVYRGTPVLLQLYLLYYGLSPILKMNAVTAAIVGLGMNYAAYEAETYRAGIAGVAKGQMEAALSLGMSRALAIRRVLLPQAFKNALPNVTSDYIALMKDSSLVSVITVVELTKQMSIASVDTRGWLVPGLLCAAMYFAMSYPLSLVARRLETRLGRS